jgi:hypothetical protein
MQQTHLIYKKGFPIDMEIAEQLNLLDSFLLWEEEQSSDIFCEQFEERFGIYPESLERFIYEHDGRIQNLEGFEWNTAYVLFDDIENSSEWEELEETLEEQEIDFEEGQWLEIN